MNQPTRAELVKDAADALRANGRVPETRVLEVLPDEVLREIIAISGEPGYVW